MMRNLTYAIAVCALIGVPAAHGQSSGALDAAFMAALTNDPEYRAARFELESREQAIPIARAGLLPSINATYAESRVRGERESTNFLGQDFAQVLNYRNPAAALQLRAPLFNLDAFNRLRSARSQVDGARSTFVARGHELLDRLGTAFAQRLFAEQVLSLAQAQVDALKGQSDMAQRRLGGGEGTRIEVAEAAASLAVARVQLLEAIDQRDIAQRTLARITGMEALPLRGLSKDSTPKPLPYARLQDWTDLALAQNPSIEVRVHQVASARYEVDRNRAGHLPRVDLVASATDSRNESISSLNQKARLYSAGIQVTIPIYAGGGVSASVSQSLSEVARAEAQLDGDRQTLVVDIRRQYQGIQSGQSKVAALNEAVAAAAVALEGARLGLTAGVRTNADVLEAVRRLYQARRDFAQARYELLLTRMRLQVLAGLPVSEIVRDVDSHLTEPAAAAVETMVTAG